MTDDFLKDTSHLNQTVIQRYLTGKLPIHLMRLVEECYDSEPVVRELFELQGAKPFHLMGEEICAEGNEFDDMTVEALLDEASNVVASIKQAEEVTHKALFDELITAALTGSISPAFYSKVCVADVSDSSIDHLHQQLLARGDGRVDAKYAKADGENAPVSSQRRAILDGDILRLNYPEGCLPTGLVWVVYLGEDPQATCQLLQLRFAFGAWIGSISIHQLIDNSKATNRHFYFVPVNEEHLRSGGGSDVRAFVESLPEGPQKSKAREWLSSLGLN